MPNNPVHPPQTTSRTLPIIFIRSVCNGIVNWLHRESQTSSHLTYGRLIAPSARDNFAVKSYPVQQSLRLEMFH